MPGIKLVHKIILLFTLAIVIIFTAVSLHHPNTPVANDKLTKNLHRQQLLYQKAHNFPPPAVSVDDLNKSLQTLDEDNTGT